MRQVRHLSLHRIAAGPSLAGQETELRVVSDVEDGVLSLIQIEEAVIRGYVQQRDWPHRWVTLFALQDLQPLIRQWGRGGSSPEGGSAAIGGELPLGLSFPPGGLAALDHRPVINMYDLSNLDSCHVFVNHQAMVQAGYWDDPVAIQGLLAHEHAHPLAENETARNSRQLRLELELEDQSAKVSDRWCSPDMQKKISGLLSLLAEKLCLYAPREVFANRVAIHSGMGKALLYLNWRNVENAGHSMVGRQELQKQLRQQVVQGTLASVEADLLLFIGDIQSHLDLALEMASFYRTEQEAAVQELEATLETAVFSHLDAGVYRAYISLRELYLALRVDMTPSELIVWGQAVLNILDQALVSHGLALHARLWAVQDQQVYGV